MFSKVPSWAKGSTHDAKSAAHLLGAIERYVEANDGSTTLHEDGARITVRGARGEKAFRLNDFVFICPADTPDTWEKMIALTLREVIPEAGLLKEARAAAEQLLSEHRDTLAELTNRASALAHLRMVVRVSAFRAEVPELKVVARPAFDRFEAVAVYDFMPQADGLPAEQVEALDLDDATILQHATDNVFNQDVKTDAGLVTTVSGPFAGSRILAPERVTEDRGFGALVTAPHRDLLVHHILGQDAPALEAAEAMAAAMYANHDGVPGGGTGRSLFWWRSNGVFREIPTIARTIVKEDAAPYELRLPDAFRREVLKALGQEDIVSR